MKVSERLKKDAQDIWDDIINHPFILELYRGTLPEEKFRNYILQDYNYLIGSIRNFSILASKAEKVETMREILKIAWLEATGEFEGYIDFINQMGISPKKAKQTQLSMEGISYVNFLLSTSSLKSIQEGITAVLPCYWTYYEIANFHRDKIDVNENKFYRQWASYYLHNDYKEVVQKLRDLTDNICKGFPYERLKEIFITSSRYELMFWESVY